MSIHKLSKFLPIFVIVGLLFSFIQPSTTVYAEGDLPPVEEPTSEVTPPIEDATPPVDVPDLSPAGVEILVVDNNGEPLPLASEEAAMVLLAPDPYLTSAGVLYTFTADDCEPLVAGMQGCPNPIQSAVNFVASGYAPDDGTIYVEDGTFNEFVSIDGNDYTGPISLNMITSLNGSSYTTLYGGFGIYNMGDFTLNGFTIFGNVEASNNAGTLTLSDLDVSGADGNGISIYNQFGDIVIKKVKSHNNYGDGLYINNMSFDLLSNNQALVDSEQELDLGTINISSSEFNQNMGDGINASTLGDIFLSYVKANENLYNGAVLAAMPFYVGFKVNENVTEEIPFPLIYVNHSEFNYNGIYEEYDAAAFPDEFRVQLDDKYYSGGGNGLIAFGGNITLDRVTANGNGYDGANTMSFGDTVVVCSLFNENGDNGLVANGFGTVDLMGVSASGNGESDIYANGYAGTNQVTYQCKKVKNSDGGDGGPEIPVTGENSEDTCAINGAVLELANLDKAIFTGLCPLKAALVGEEEPTLPGTLPDGGVYVSSFTASVLQEGQVLDVLPAGGSITISFNLTDEMKGKTLEIYYWDPGANSGAGEWIVVPAKGDETSFTPFDDTKLVLSGGQDAGDGAFNAIVNFSGTFILVVK